MKLPHPARRLLVCLGSAAAIAFAAVANEATAPSRDELDRLNERVNRTEDRQYNQLWLVTAGSLAGGAIGGYGAAGRRKPSTHASERHDHANE